MNQIVIKFDGDASADTAKKMFTWLVDGGLEDYVIDNLSDESVTVDGITGCSAEEMTITFSTRKNIPE